MSLPCSKPSICFHLILIKTKITKRFVKFYMIWSHASSQLSLPCSRCSHHSDILAVALKSWACFMPWTLLLWAPLPEMLLCWSGWTSYTPPLHLHLNPFIFSVKASLSAPFKSRHPTTCTAYPCSLFNFSLSTYSIKHIISFMYRFSKLFSSSKFHMGGICLGFVNSYTSSTLNYAWHMAGAKMRTEST